MAKKKTPPASPEPARRTAVEPLVFEIAPPIDPAPEPDRIVPRRIDPR